MNGLVCPYCGSYNWKKICCGNVRCLNCGKEFEEAELTKEK